MVNYYFLDHVSTWHQLSVNMLHMMLWFLYSFKGLGFRVQGSGFLHAYKGILWGSVGVRLSGLGIRGKRKWTP